MRTPSTTTAGSSSTGSYMDYCMPRADNLPSFTVGTHTTLCTHNPAGRQRLRRGGRHRRADRGDERRHRRACRRSASRILDHARDARKGVARHPWRRTETGGGIRERAHVQFQLSQAARASPTPPRLGAGEEAKLLAGGMTLIPTLKQRLAKPSDLVDLAKIAELKGIKRDGNAIVIGAMTRHVEVATSDVVKAHPGTGASRRRHRRSAGAQPRHHRRLDRQQRSGGGLSLRRAGIRRHGHHQQAQDRGRRLLQGHVRDRARARRDRHRRAASRSRRKRAIPNSPTPRRAMRSSASSSPRPASGVRVAVTGAAPCVFRQKDMEAALGKSFTPDAVASIKQSASGLNSDIHASAEYRAHLVTVMAKRAVAAAG